MTEALSLGKAVERQALDYLSRAGLIKVAANWSCRFGEIDLIMLEQSTDTLVFVEVRYRKNTQFGGALESIDHTKRTKLINTAEYFLNEYPQWLEHSCRFDVITAQLNQQQDITLDWIQDAFES